MSTLSSSMLTILVIISCEGLTNIVFSALAGFFSHVFNWVCENIYHYFQEMHTQINHLNKIRLQK